ncbi:MAG: class I SAM-dependent methyltransferase [Chloroflexi bacterium]|nr:class I SAM-dependent methyltransferase [Chloroflexota bacterium]
MPDAPPPQNVYDDPEFFAGYSTMERFGAGWVEAGERPDFLRLLPDASGLRVLDLGCGAGQLARHLAEAGAADVIGVDISERMLEVARSQFAHPRVSYRRDAIEAVDYPDARFELVVSSLAFHYVEDYATLARSIARWLAPGGRLVFSTEHPLYTARGSEEGWVRGADGTTLGWLIDGYAEEGLREHRWFVDGVRRYHRTFETLVNALLDAGLTVERVIEPVGEAWLAKHPEAEDERRRPMFLLVGARKH